jgi:hypothetical protein
MSLSELLARVEAATGPDDELSRDIAVAFGPGSAKFPACAGYIGIGNFTGSLDAAMRLLQQARPNVVGVVSFGGVWSRCDFLDAGGVRVHATCRSPALAVVATLLRDLVADAEQREVTATGVSDEVPGNISNQDLRS